MIWARFGVHGNIAIFAINTDATDLGILTCFGYFIISIIQIIGILCDDKQSRVQVVLLLNSRFFQNVISNSIVQPISISHLGCAFCLIWVFLLSWIWLQECLRYSTLDTYSYQSVFQRTRWFLYLHILFLFGRLIFSTDEIEISRQWFLWFSLNFSSLKNLKDDE